MENRNYIIDRLRSKTVSIDEFNYDRLQAPPISCMFTPQDIAQLNMIAKSIRYAAKPEVKYREIDKIMRSRGFEKFIAGTNRVVYRPLEDNTFLVKVAADAVGLGDNPREYRNQFIFKPFVTKVFEITPCGTLGVFERVVPITSREEFLSVASDIYEVINNWFVGEYVLEDIGTNFFMNWGIRKSFGPVLLDFPYVYRLDGDKLFCNAPSNTPSGCCEGTIDYDPGYNFLYCTKCGVKYKAKELSKAIEMNEVIVKSEGEVKMKVSIKGGTKNVNSEVTTGEYAGMAKSIRTSSNYFGVKVQKSKQKGKLKDNYKEKNDNSKEDNSEEVIKVESTKEEKVKVISPIEFDESLKQKNEDSETENANAVEIFNMLLNQALNILETANEEVKKELSESIAKAFADEIEEAARKVFENNCEDSGEEKEKATPHGILAHIIKASNMFSDLAVDGGGFHAMEEYLDEEKTELFVNDISSNFVKFFLNTIIGSRFYFNAKHSNLYYSKEEDVIVQEVYPGIMESTDKEEDNWLIIDSEPVKYGLLIDNELLKEAGYAINSDQNTEDGKYGSCKYYAGKVINIKDLFEDQQSGKIIVLIDESGNYVTNGAENDIIAVDVIDNKSVDALSIVSSEWLSAVLKEREESQENESEEDENNKSDEIPTGVLPPSMTVNGVTESAVETKNDEEE